MPILAVIGIDPEGKRDILAFSVDERENQDAWEALFEQLKERGVEQIDLWCMDGHKAMVGAMNPCHCGYYGDPFRPCTCPGLTVTKYQKRISGPLLDRIDINIQVPREAGWDAIHP